VTTAFGSPTPRSTHGGELRPVGVGCPPTSLLGTLLLTAAVDSMSLIVSRFGQRHPAGEAQRRRVRQRPGR